MTAVGVEEEEEGEVAVSEARRIAYAWWKYHCLEMVLTV